MEGLFAGVLWWVVHIHVLALDSSVAAQHFWLLLPVFSIVLKLANRKIDSTCFKLKYPPVREPLIVGVLWHLMHLHSLALKNKCDEAALLAASLSV